MLIIQNFPTCLSRFSFTFSFVAHITYQLVHTHAMCMYRCRQNIISPATSTTDSMRSGEYTNRQHKTRIQRYRNDAEIRALTAPSIIFIRTSRSHAVTL